jgi:hypothetical protein
MGDFTGAKKAAKIQASATDKAATLQANNDKLAAQAAQSSVETTIAQDKAASAAADLLSTPMDQVDVLLGSNTDSGTTVDKATGKRRTIRSKFNLPTAAGLNI